jgi:hypothetical protein
MDDIFKPRIIICNVACKPQPTTALRRAAPVTNRSMMFDYVALLLAVINTHS